MRGIIDAQPFRITVPDETLVDLKERLARTRWPIEPTGPAWRYGASLAYMREVADYWGSRYDWRQAEAELNTHSHFKASIGGKQVHFLAEIGSGPAPLPLLLTHGWPGSIVEFLDIIAPLAHPELHGGKVEDAFTVIAPSLPGYGFSDPPDAPITPRDIAHIWHALMSETLGATRYVAQGGDWGSVVTSWLALDHPGALAAIHLNMVGLRPALVAGGPPPTPAERAYFNLAQQRREHEIAYQQIQGTKPQTLSYGLTDSPIGLAAWILEKFHGWTIPGQDAPPPFALDRLLTNIMLYWLAGINGANWLYCSIMDGTAATLKGGERVDVPTGLCLFPNDLLLPPPRSWVERAYNVAQYRVAPSGGHFPAMENGPLLVGDMRSFFARYR
jgi:pimeloyl-ACP methyl ester carboxylesterase